MLDVAVVVVVVVAGAAVEPLTFAMSVPNFFNRAVPGI